MTPNNEALAALKSLFKDAMDWGRSYGTRLNLSDITVDDVSEGYAEKALAALASSGQAASAVPAQPKLIGWRSSDYLYETTDRSMAENWAPAVGVLPIFEGDPNTKLTTQPVGQAASAAPTEAEEGDDSIKLSVKRDEWEQLSPAAQKKLEEVVWKGAKEYRRQQAEGRAAILDKPLLATPAAPAQPREAQS